MRPETIIEAVRRCGLDGIAITDHNSTAGAVEVSRLAPFPVIIGEEIKTSQGEIIGLFLQETIAPGQSPQETISAIRAQNGLVYIPHPLDRVRRSPLRRAALDAILDQVDLIETFNARVTLPRDNAEAARLAQEHGLPGGGGSDAHSAGEIGRAYIELPAFSGPESFRQQLGQAQVRGRLSPFWVHFWSSWAKWARKLRRPSH